jgi:hypothetical protein
MAGQVKFDNFQGRWGEQKHLDQFLQAYAVEKCRLEARKKRHLATEGGSEPASCTLRASARNRYLGGLGTGVSGVLADFFGLKADR